MLQEVDHRTYYIILQMWLRPNLAHLTIIGNLGFDLSYVCFINYTIRQFFLSKPLIVTANHKQEGYCYAHQIVLLDTMSVIHVAIKGSVF